MKKLSVFASSVVLSIAAVSSHATIYNITLDLNGVITGATGTQIGAGVGTYDDVTQIMVLDTTYRINSNGFFGLGRGVMDQTGESIYNFTSLTGTNEVLTCVQVSGSGCAQVPGGPQTLGSLSAINWGTMQFTTVSTYLVATTTQTWSITSMEGPAPEVPVPAAAWLFGSALLGLGGIVRRRGV